MLRKLLVISLALSGLALAVPAVASAKPCKRVANPYEGTRYEGSDLYRIHASRRVSCRTARRVARRGHRKALRANPDRYGIVRVTWRGWKIAGDLVGSHDQYFATKPGRRKVSWRF